MKTKVPKAEIDRLMRQFNFQKVRKVMRLLNWKWTDKDGASVPTIEAIKECARRLLTDVNTMELLTGSRSGGFEVDSYLDGDTNRQKLTLAFVVESEETD